MIVAAAPLLQNAAAERERAHLAPWRPAFWPPRPVRLARSSGLGGVMKREKVIPAAGRERDSRPARAQVAPPSSSPPLGQLASEGAGRPDRSRTHSSDRLQNQLLSAGRRKSCADALISARLERHSHTHTGGNRRRHLRFKAAAKLGERLATRRAPASLDGPIGSL